jgi:hypothetical protein
VALERVGLTETAVKQQVVIEQQGAKARAVLRNPRERDGGLDPEGRAVGIHGPVDGRFVLAEEEEGFAILD